MVKTQPLKRIKITNIYQAAMLIEKAVVKKGLNGL